MVTITSAINEKINTINEIWIDGWKDLVLTRGYIYGKLLIGYELKNGDIDQVWLNKRYPIYDWNDVMEAFDYDEDMSKNYILEQIEDWWSPNEDMEYYENMMPDGWKNKILKDTVIAIINEEEEARKISEKIDVEGGWKDLEAA